MPRYTFAVGDLVYLTNWAEMAHGRGPFVIITINEIKHTNHTTQLVALNIKGRECAFAGAWLIPANTHGQTNKKRRQQKPNSSTAK